MAEPPEEGEAEDGGDRAPTNVVIFRSALMGISMDRQDDGHVRVLKVTEPSTDESVDRVGRIALRDRVLDAARIDLRDPITEEEWRRTVIPAIRGREVCFIQHTFVERSVDKIGSVRVSR